MDGRGLRELLPWEVAVCRNHSLLQASDQNSAPLRLSEKPFTTSRTLPGNVLENCSHISSEQDEGGQLTASQPDPASPRALKGGRDALGSWVSPPLTGSVSA